MSLAIRLICFMNKEEDSHHRTSDSLVHGMEGQCTHQYAQEPMMAEGPKERLTAVLAECTLCPKTADHKNNSKYYALADITLLF